LFPIYSDSKSIIESQCKGLKQVCRQKVLVYLKKLYDIAMFA